MFWRKRTIDEERAEVIKARFIQVEAERDQARALVGKLEIKLAEARKREAEEERLRNLKQEMQTPDEVAMRLGELAEHSPILIAFLTLIKLQGEIERDAAIAPGLSPEMRSYNAGRAAAVADAFYQIQQTRERGEAMLRGQRMPE